MRIITAAGYYGTGTSAIIDLLKEYNDFCLVGQGDYEIRFVQDPDGISDLFYNLVENNHRHNSSDAIKRFIKYCKYLNGDFYSKRYRKFFGNNFKILTSDYVNAITQLKVKTWWHIDLIRKGRFINFIDLCLGKIARKLKRAEEMPSIACRNEYGYYTYLTEDDFCNITKKYLDDLFGSVCTSNNVLVEQLVPPSNVKRYAKFFNDLKVIVVDRDPRDIYIASREIYKTKIIPVDNAEDFCKWYRITREHRKHDSEKDYLLIRFEDMIYNYEKTIKMIESFVGTTSSEHLNKNKYFNPSVSIRGTKLFLKYPKYEKDVEYIEKELNEYLFNYE